MGEPGGVIWRLGGAGLGQEGPGEGGMGGGGDTTPVGSNEGQGC